MNRWNPSRLITVIVLSVGLACKKPVEPTPASPPPPPPPPEAPSQVPLKVIKMVQNFQRVYFEFDSATLTSGTKSALDQNIAIMKDSGSIRIEVQGHADERGTTSYNLALGERRARAVGSYMNGSGITDSRVKVISYGEERPLQRGGIETAWSKNRRCEFVITYGADESVSGSSQ